MRIPILLRAATAALLATGLTAVGITAAAADDVPLPPATSQSAPPEEPSAPEPEPATEPAPAEEPQPEAEPAPKDAEPASEPETASGPQQDVLAPNKPAAGFAAGRVALSSAVTDPTPYVLLAWRLTCYDWQVDLENDSVTTRSLMAIGTLTAPNVPPEDHAYGALGANVNPWKLVDNPDCPLGQPVTPAASVTDQTCAQGTVIVGGTIQLTLMAGVTYTITGTGGAVAFDPVTGLASGLDPGAYSVGFALDPGYTTAVTSPISLTVGAYTPFCGITVTPAAVGTDQQCLRSVLLVDGHIEVSIMAGVTYSITGPGGAVAFDPVTGATAVLPAGAYSVAFALDPGYATAVMSPILITIAPYVGACAPIPITPAATATD